MYLTKVYRHMSSNALYPSRFWILKQSYVNSFGYLRISPIPKEHLGIAKHYVEMTKELACT